MLKLDYRNVMREAVGEAGLTPELLAQGAARAADALQDMAAARQAGEMDFLNLPYQEENVRALNAAARELAPRFENLVVLGIGGSALGTIALRTALAHPYYNLLSREQRKGYPRVWVADNVDPVGFRALLEIAPPERTLFNVISKSGATAETMSQYLIVRRELEQRLGPARLREHLVITTDPEKGVLRRIINAEGFRSFSVPPGVGGRFSALTSVGLFPAAMMGIPVAELLAGAAEMDQRIASAPAQKNPAALLALIYYLMDQERKRRILVYFPYADGLKDIADWFRQLWAESLGKKEDVDGRVVRAGTTLVKALGATDQHSQLQLYLAGPPDKVITFLAPEKFAADLSIPKLHKDEEALNYLGGHTLGELILAEQEATAYSLSRQGVPHLKISLPEISPYHIGALMFLLECATVIAGRFYRVNPFDQPGVEDGKNFTYGLMGRKGFADKAQAIQEMKAIQHDYIV